MASFDESRRRFLAGFAARANLDPAHLDSPGTVLAAREERAGTGIVTVYWADRRTVIWFDPQVRDRVAGLEHPTKSATAKAIDEGLAAAGFEHGATADMRVLDGTVFEGLVALPPYQPQRLAADAPETLAMVRRFAERCSPDDVEVAGLEDLDNFAERAINVLTTASLEGSEPGAGPVVIVAYASACEWDWDPGFTDIGVLVDVEHRGLGLGRCVVTGTVRQLLDEGRLPLYRHDQANVGSRALASGLGFRPATTLGVYRLAGPESSSPELDE